MSHKESGIGPAAQEQRGPLEDPAKSCRGLFYNYPSLNDPLEGVQELAYTPIYPYLMPSNGLVDLFTLCLPYRSSLSLDIACSGYCYVSGGSARASKPQAVLDGGTVKYGVPKDGVDRYGMIEAKSGGH